MSKSFLVLGNVVVGLQVSSDRSLGSCGHSGHDMRLSIENDADVSADDLFVYSFTPAVTTERRDGKRIITIRSSSGMPDRAVHSGLEVSDDMVITKIIWPLWASNIFDKDLVGATLLEINGMKLTDKESFRRVKNTLKKGDKPTFLIDASAADEFKNQNDDDDTFLSSVGGNRRGSLKKKSRRFSFGRTK